MKRIVRLTERDLTRIVKRVINEELKENWISNLFGGKKNEKSSSSSNEPSSNGPRKEYYICDGWGPGRERGGGYYYKGEWVDVLYINPSAYPPSGYKKGGHACPGDLQDVF